MSRHASWRQDIADPNSALSQRDAQRGASQGETVVKINADEAVAERVAELRFNVEDLIESVREGPQNERDRAFVYLKDSIQMMGQTLDHRDAQLLLLARVIRAGKTAAFRFDSLDLSLTDQLDASNLVQRLTKDVP